MGKTTSIGRATKIASDFKKEHPKLSEFEALTLAIQLQRNQILKAAFAVSSTDAHPSALEAMATALGHRQ